MIVDDETKPQASPGVDVTLRVSRGRAVTRAILWSAPTAIALAIAAVVYPSLDFGAPSTVNKLVSYSAALITLPAPLAALACGFKLVRYLLLAVWPAQLGVSASRRGLSLKLGPFGRRQYDSDDLDVLYPVEQTETDDGGGFEAFLPEEQQLTMLLPRITHPAAPEPLNRTLLRFCLGDEASIAVRLRPAIREWRSMRVVPDGNGERDRDA